MEGGKLNKMIYCPCCGSQQDGFSGKGEPSDRDITVCLYCLSINQFVMVDGELEIHKTPQWELDSIRKNDPALWNTIQETRRFAKRILTEKQKTNN